MVGSSEELLLGLDWETLAEAIPDLVSIHDKNFCIIWANQRFFSKFGIRAEELIGKKCYELVHSSNAPYPTCPHRRAMETDKVEVEEVVIGDDTYLISCAPIIIQGEVRNCYK